jgi:predicted RND superfamily exporter protein
VNDALVLVTTYNQQLKIGDRVVRSLYQATLSRFRPIILTTVTTIAGLGPLILEKSFQAQFLIPMAASVAFGLAMVTVLTLVLLPAFLLMMSKIKVWAVLQWEGISPDPRSIESAVDGRKSYLWLWIFFGLISILGFVGLIMLTLRISNFLIS